jgi:hypothetical protein
VRPAHEHHLRDALELDVQLVAADKGDSGTSSVAGFLVSRSRFRGLALEPVFSRETWH